MSIILPELTPSILCCLSNEEIYEFMKTCKLFYSVLSPIYYQKVVLHPNEHKKFLRLTEKTRIDGSKLGDYVKELKLHKRSINSPYLDEEELHRLISNLPVLRKLVMENSVGYEYYLRYLKSMPVSSVGQIQEVSISKDTAHSMLSINDHIAINYRLRDKIRSLHCHYFILSGDSFDIFGKLRDFKILQHLYISRLAQPTELIPVINECKNLLSFESDCFFNWGDLPTINNRVLFKDMTSLKFGVKVFDLRHINYLMQSYPNLNQLHLSLQEASLLATIISLKNDHSTDFIQYLRRMNSVTLRNTDIDDHLIHQNTVTRSLTLIHLLQGVCEPGSLCDLNMYFAPLPLERDHFILEKHSKNVYVSTAWLMDIFNDDFSVDRLGFLTLNSISVAITNVNGQRDFGFIDPLIAFIKKGKRYCPIFINSKQQRFVFCTKPKPGARFVGSIDTLRMFHKRNQNRYTQQPTITYGCVKKIPLSNNLLRSLGHLYPSVEELVFESCQFDHKERTKKYHIDLSHFMDIHFFCFDLDSVLSTRKLKHPLYIVLESPHYGVEYYCLNERSNNSFEHLKDHKESDIPLSAYVIKISYVRIRYFIYERLKKTYKVKLQA